MMVTSRVIYNIALLVFIKNNQKFWRIIDLKSIFLEFLIEFMIYFTSLNITRIKSVKILTMSVKTLTMSVKTLTICGKTLTMSVKILIFVLKLYRLVLIFFLLC